MPGWGNSACRVVRPKKRVCGGKAEEGNTVTETQARPLPVLSGLGCGWRATEQ